MGKEGSLLQTAERWTSRNLEGRLNGKELKGAQAQFPGALRSLRGQPLILWEKAADKNISTENNPTCKKVLWSSPSQHTGLPAHPYITD